MHLNSLTSTPSLVFRVLSDDIERLRGHILGASKIPRRTFNRFIATLFAAPKNLIAPAPLLKPSGPLNLADAETALKKFISFFTSDFSNNAHLAILVNGHHSEYVLNENQNTPAIYAQVRELYDSLVANSALRDLVRQGDLDHIFSENAAIKEATFRNIAKWRKLQFPPNIAQQIEAWVWRENQIAKLKESIISGKNPLPSLEEFMSMFNRQLQWVRTASAQTTSHKNKKAQRSEEPASQQACSKLEEPLIREYSGSNQALTEMIYATKCLKPLHEPNPPFKSV